MSFDLLSQNFILIICAIVTALLIYLAISIWRPNPAKKLTKKLIEANKKRKIIEFSVAIGASLVLSLIIDLVISHITESQLPLSFIVMVLPATVVVCLFGLVIYSQKKITILATLSLLIGVMFSLFLINDYYRFFPTLGQVFNKNNAALLANSQKEVLLEYNAATNSTDNNSQSIEGGLSLINKQPTAGKVYQLNIPGTISKFHARSAFVYVPSIYSNPSGFKLPVIVLTAGVPGLPENWLGAGLQQIMDTFANRHEGITPIVFMVDNTGSIANDTECVDSPRGNVETYLTVDVPNYIKQNFSVNPLASHWAIGGLSMGGMCSIMLTLRHTNVYNYFIDLGGEIGPETGDKSQSINALFNGSETNWAAHQPSLIMASHTYKNIGGFFGVGKEDAKVVVDAQTQLSSEAKKAGIETIEELVNGPHSFNIWQQTYKDALPWISNRIGATRCGLVCV